MVSQPFGSKNERFGIMVCFPERSHSINWQPKGTEVNAGQDVVTLGNYSLSFLDHPPLPQRTKVSLLIPLKQIKHPFKQPHLHIDGSGYHGSGPPTVVQNICMLSDICRWNKLGLRASPSIFLTWNLVWFISSLTASVILIVVLQSGNIPVLKNSNLIWQKTWNTTILCGNSV